MKREKSLMCLINQQIMMMYGGVVVQLHELLIFPRERTVGTRWM
jgi:hypothetical protein